MITTEKSQEQLFPDHNHFLGERNKDLVNILRKKEGGFLFNANINILLAYHHPHAGGKDEELLPQRRVVGYRIKEVSRWLTRSMKNVLVVGLALLSARWKRSVRARIDTRLIRKNVLIVAPAPMLVR